MAIRTRSFDTAQHLDNPEVIAWYVADALQTGDNKVILNAIRNVVRAGNMSRIARETGLSRTSLYWDENASPEFTTVLKVLDARGVRLRVEPIEKAPPRKVGKRLIQAAKEGVAFARGELDPAHHDDDDSDVGRSRVSFMHQSPGMFGGGKARAWKRGARAPRKKKR